MRKIKCLNKIQYGLLAFLLFAANFWFMTTTVSAASLTNTYLQPLQRMKAGQGTTLRLYVKTVASTSGATTASIDMNGVDATTWQASSGTVASGAMTVATAACVTATGAAALPGSPAATGNGTNLISITGISGITAAPTQYCIDFTTTASITNATAGEYHPVITIGTDTITVAVRTISNDQIVVSATVPPTFNLALSGNTDAFTANLSAATVGVTTGRTITINTNAKNGWLAWAFDSSTGLISAVGAHTIASTTPGTTATLSAGTEGYVFGITAITQGTGGGTTSAIAAYSSNGTTTGSGLDTTVRQIASSTGTANGAVLTVKELAAITAVTQAATDYTDTITILGAGYF